MKFSETKSITLPKYQKSFIYFLLKNDDVVYVGQTKSGITRPLTHKDKDYDTIKLLYCDVKDLNILEDKYIKKYKPIYNKAINYYINYSFCSARNKIRNVCNDKTFNVPKLKKLIKKLDIKTYYINENVYINVADVEKIIEYKMGEQK